MAIRVSPQRWSLPSWGQGHLREDVAKSDLRREGTVGFSLRQSSRLLAACLAANHLLDRSQQVGVLDKVAG